MKLKSYKSYVALFVSYGSSLWKPSKRDLKIIESVQKKATEWILSPTQEYKDRLISLHIIPLSLHHELHIPLLLHKIPTKKTDLKWKKIKSVKKKGQARYASMTNYESKQFRLQKSESDFFLRACNITNAWKEYLKFNIMEHENLKELITNVFWRYFKEKLNKNYPCSWRIDCRCMNCKNIRILNFIFFLYDTNSFAVYCLIIFIDLIKSITKFILFMFNHFEIFVLVFLFWE